MLGDMFWKSWVGFNLAGIIRTFYNTSAKKKHCMKLKKSYKIWVILGRKRLFVDNPTSLLFYFCFWRHFFFFCFSVNSQEEDLNSPCGTQTVDWAREFSHRIRILGCKQSKLLEQPSQVLCWTKVTSTTTTMMAVHYICVSQNQALTKTT